MQALVEVFKRAGFTGSGEFLSHYDGNIESLKNLAYQLYGICERNKKSKEGTGYNAPVVEWQDILQARADFLRRKNSGQITLIG